MKKIPESLLSVYLEMLECECDEPKYGDEPDPLAQHSFIADRCMSIECPIQREKCLQLMNSLGLGTYRPPEEF